MVGRNLVINDATLLIKPGIIINFFLNILSIPYLATYSLDKYFIENSNLVLPTVEKLSIELNVSSSYLSDMLRNLTGQNTQQHIHNRLIEKSKEILTTTNMTVSEIAYQLGFEYPQSFSKLFKSKTNITPLQYRSSFN